MAAALTVKLVTSVLNPGSGARSTLISVGARTVAFSLQVSTSSDGGPDTGPVTVAARLDGAASGGVVGSPLITDTVPLSMLVA